MNRPNTALLLIDIQQGLDDLSYYGGQRNNPHAETNCRKLLDFFRDSRWPVFHVQHNSTNLDSPLHPSKPGNRIKSIVEPMDHETVVQKNVNSAFIGTDLHDKFEALGITDIVIVGLTTEHCVSTTARMAANLGFKVSVVSDAVAAFSKVGVNGEFYEAQAIHLVTLATLKDEFASIMDTQKIIEELAANNPLVEE